MRLETYWWRKLEAKLTHAACNLNAHEKSILCEQSAHRTFSQESLLQARLIADAIMQKLAVENLTFTRGNKQVTASLQLC